MQTGSARIKVCEASMRGFGMEPISSKKSEEIFLKHKGHGEKSKGEVLRGSVISIVSVFCASTLSFFILSKAVLVLEAPSNNRPR